MGKILTQNNVSMGVPRIRIERLQLLLINTPDNLSSKELMSCKQDISQLSDSIEDQYVGFNILTSLNACKLYGEDIEQTKNIIKGFEPMDETMQRLKKKADSSRLQYMLIQQEKLRCLH